MDSRLPVPVGELSEFAVSVLAGRQSERVPELPGDPLDRDAQLAWFMLNEVSYRGWAEVDDAIEWDPSVVRARRMFEQWFVERVRGLLPPTADTPVQAAERALAPAGPSLTAFLERQGRAAHVVEHLLLKYPYQRIEADPHTFVVPRLAGQAKRALCEIQAGEYGVGHDSTHAELFEEALHHLVGPVDATALYGVLPGAAFATANLVSLGGLNRCFRGIALGQLALFEMDSVVPNQRLVHACDRLDLPEATRRFHQIHVWADTEHAEIARRSFLVEYPRDEPGQVANVTFGIETQAYIDRRLAALVLDRWRQGRSALHVHGAPRLGGVALRPAA